MKKPIKLLLYLLLSAAILFFLWARAECPHLTAQGALNRIESANLAPKSQLISTHFLDIINSTGTNYRRHMAAGVTDTPLHMSEVWKKACWQPASAWSSLAVICPQVPPAAMRRRPIWTMPEKNCGWHRTV